ncbi:4a-hydroxytetrahydrobiopterin dehydratase [Piscinibacter sp.]|uniref:4a-hydroxytetrahydrobiopterin dehydratase n=1 Tax=Piscinibacter sp. TaxID=1903157 RepID=UPI002CE2A4B9|nr:4a-hydroxytetrahydrobiopterin dehydratase [Albitalea sp.]HUG24854.1 4a-hydroxytetrahydrobiopterin dehydratase [Albitalea sp.]
MSHLLHSKCQVLDGGKPMNEDEVHRHLNEVSGWHLNNGAIEKSFNFKDYLELMAFINAMAWICHTEDHHPDVAMGYNRCTVRFNTHSVGGISVNDFICAAKVNALVAFVA